MLKKTIKTSELKDLLLTASLKDGDIIFCDVRGINLRKFSETKFPLGTPKILLVGVVPQPDETIREAVLQMSDKEFGDVIAERTRIKAAMEMPNAPSR